MATGSILETPVLLREPSKFRPRPNPFFHKFQSRLPLSLPTSHKFMRVSIQSVPNPMAALRPCAAAAYSSLEERNKFARAVLETLRALRKSAIAVIFLGFLLTADPLPALAASGGRMGGSAFSSSSRSHSSSSSSRSHSSSSLHSYSRPSISSFSYSVPYYAPSPFGAGGGLVRAVGVGFNSEGGFILLMFCFAAVILLAGIISDQRDGGSVLADTQKTSVLKLQVDVKRTIEGGEKRFNKLSIEERGKFDEETLVNVNNIKRRKTTSQRSKGFSNEYIVITILVAAEGVYKLPVINGSADLKEALQKLASIPSRKTLAVEVLWTPQNENDALSERELLEDYPLLRPL
ncbi:FLUCTUATING-LIGHT-ACCLIMATION protein 1, chloroplastic isoform X2 [Elaeis guineensis]|uniref:FLUCTUATING-LIGHT-ACCLIMATION protein 1, chloroplastic isoform X2 n=1 Tax=Elaeis guineensis var. tenera TaxID=51953 RepID=UPI003C6D743D